MASSTQVQMFVSPSGMQQVTPSGVGETGVSNCPGPSHLAWDSGGLRELQLHCSCSWELGQQSSLQFWLTHAATKCTIPLFFYTGFFTALKVLHMLSKHSTQLNGIAIVPG